MTSRPRLTLVLAAAFTASASGCSFLSVYGPTYSPKPVVGVSCTDERYAPALDTATASTYLLGSALTDRTSGERAALVLAALAWGGSAVYGYMTTVECQKAKDADSRYHTKVLLRQIDLLNEAASQGQPDETSAPSDAPAEEPPPSHPAPPESPTTPVQ